MAKQKQSQSSETVGAQSSSSVAAGNQAATSNSMQLEKLRASQKAEGIANYSSALGKYLGPGLYKAVEGILNESEMAELASGAIDSALQSLFSHLGESTDNAALQNDALMADASKAIANELESLIEKWLGDEKGTISKDMLAEMLLADDDEEKEG